MNEHKIRRAGKAVPPTPPAAPAPIKTGGKAERDNQGRFAPGNAANPKGRPRGSRSKATILLMESLGKKSPDLLKKMIEKAEAGDVNALRFLLERLLPPCKSAPVDVSLPDDPQRASALLVGMAANGQIAPKDAVDLAELVRLHADLTDMKDLRQRIEALEARGA